MNFCRKLKFCNVAELLQHWLTYRSSWSWLWLDALIFSYQLFKHNSNVSNFLCSFLWCSIVYMLFEKKREIFNENETDNFNLKIINLLLFTFMRLFCINIVFFFSDAFLYSPTQTDLFVYRPSSSSSSSFLISYCCSLCFFCFFVF